MSTTILAKDQYETLYWASYSSLLSCLWALYRGHSHLALVPGSVFLSSINYWRNPVEGTWRRYIDMGVVQAALFYQLLMTTRAQYALAYYILTGLGILSFPIGVYYYHKKEYWASTYAHMMLHVLANIGNVVLYWGAV